LKAAFTILFFCVYLCCQGQYKYTYLQTKQKVFSSNDKHLILVQLIGGFADGWNQAIALHGWGVGKRFWDYNTSWKLKYKDFDGGDLRAAYLGSKSFLAWTVDGFHSTRFVYHNSMTVSIVLTRNDLKNWKQVLKKLGMCTAANRMGFWIGYDNVFAK
jgi:hypothetical protein